MIKIRLSRHGAKKKPFYKIIVADIRSPRNGKFIEKIGFFNPLSKKKAEKIKFSIKKVIFWINKGAQISRTVKNLMKKEKIYEKYNNNREI